MQRVRISEEAYKALKNARSAIRDKGLKEQEFISSLILDTLEGDGSQYAINPLFEKHYNHLMELKHAPHFLWLAEQNLRSLAQVNQDVKLVPADTYQLHTTVVHECQDPMLLAYEAAGVPAVIVNDKEEPLDFNDLFVDFANVFESCDHVDDVPAEYFMDRQHIFQVNFTPPSLFEHCQLQAGKQTWKVHKAKPKQRLEERDVQATLAPLPEGRWLISFHDPIFDAGRQARGQSQSQTDTQVS